MESYRNKRTGSEITSYEYDRLPSWERSDYNKVDNSGSVVDSAILGAVTDNALIGGILGGSFLGGVIGDMLNDGELF